MHVVRIAHGVSDQTSHVILGHHVIHNITKFFKAVDVIISLLLAKKTSQKHFAENNRNSSEIFTQIHYVT